MGGKGVIPHPPQRSAHRRSQGVGMEVSGAARHARRIAVGSGPAAPGSGFRPRSPFEGGRAGRSEGAAPGGAACRRGRTEGQALAPAQGPPPGSLGRPHVLPAGSLGFRRPSRGGGGGEGEGEGRVGGGGVPRPPPWPRLAPGGATVPRRLRPLLYRLPPTVAWGPVPPPGPAPAPGGDLVPSPRPRAPSWAVGV